MKAQEKIYDFHAEHLEWKNRLNFYKDEIQILQGRLGEIAAKNNQKEMLKKVEHFQNQFIIQRHNIHDIRHAVKRNEKQLISGIKQNPVASDRRHATKEDTEEHSKERELVNSFEKNFNEICNEFKVFAAKWM